jgi:hypothetical protein
MPDPYTPSGRAPPQMALWPFGGWLARRAGGLQPSSSPLDTPRRTGLEAAVFYGNSNVVRIKEIKIEDLLCVGAEVVTCRASHPDLPFPHSTLGAPHLLILP